MVPATRAPWRTSQRPLRVSSTSVLSPASACRPYALPIATSTTARGILLTVRPFAFRPDADGHVFASNVNFYLADSVLVALEHPLTGRIDTVARVRGAYRGAARLRGPSPRGGRMPYYL